jgi:hypothetical protein
LACASVSLNATEYFVDGTVAGTGAGTAGNPWRQISSAISSLQPGDVVHVSAGLTIHSRFSIEAASPEAHLLHRRPGEAAVINGGLPSGNRDGIRIRDSSHLVLDGFTLVGTGNLSTSRAGISVQSSALGSVSEMMRLRKSRGRGASQ